MEPQTSVATFCEGFPRRGRCHKNTALSGLPKWRGTVSGSALPCFQALELNYYASHRQDIAELSGPHAEEREEKGMAAAELLLVSFGTVAVYEGGGHGADSTCII